MTEIADPSSGEGEGEDIDTRCALGTEVPPNARPPKWWWVIPVALLVCLGAVLLVVAVDSKTSASAAKGSLLATVNVVERIHQDQATAGFSRLTLAQLHDRLPSIDFVDGATVLHEADGSKVGVDLCVTSSGCDAIVMVTRGQHKTCWYAAIALTSRAAASLGFDSRTIGVQYAMTPGASSCSAGVARTPTRQPLHWQDQIPSGS